MPIFQYRDRPSVTETVKPSALRSRLLLTAAMAFGLICFSVGGPALATALSDPTARGAGSASGSGLVAADPDTINADEVTLGSTTQVVVRFRNDSSKEVKVGQINLYPSSTVNATIGLNECGGDPIPAGAECAVVVAVKGLKVGSWRVEMLVRHDGRARIVTAAIDGTVAEGNESNDKLLSDIETIPSELDFGSLDSSQQVVKTAVLRNVTSEPVDITNVSIEASVQSGYTLTTDCGKLDVGQACLATITWAPTAKGTAEGMLLIQHDGPTKVASVSLKGKFDPKESEKATIFPTPVPGLGLLIASQETLDFGTISNEASMTVSLVNVGDVDMKLTDIRLAGIDNGLSLAPGGCGPNTVLEPIEACPLTVSWAPTKVGSIIDDLQIRHDGARGVLVIPIRGIAEGVVNRDTQAVVIKEGVEETKRIDKRQALDGFVVTSHSPTRAIINGPGGSRVINNGQQIVLGGMQWSVSITKTGVEFISGAETVRLLFDRSLSSVNRSGSVSSSGSASSGTASTTPTPAATTTTQ